MWKITYFVEKHFRDRDNYPTSTPDDVKTAWGETKELAISDLISRLIKNKDLDNLLQSEINRQKDYVTLEIISFDYVTESNDGFVYNNNMMNHPLFVELIDAKKKELNDLREQKWKQLREQEKAEALSIYYSIKRKYNL